MAPNPDPLYVKAYGDGVAAEYRRITRNWDEVRRRLLSQTGQSFVDIVDLAVRQALTGEPDGREKTETQPPRPNDP